MVELETKNTLAMLAALSQETRLEVFRRLVVAGPDGLAAGDISRTLGVPSNTMSTHLAILERSGLVVSMRMGRSIIYSANLDAMNADHPVDALCPGQIHQPPLMRAAQVHQRVQPGQ
ncbi:MAG: hypothetical protein ABS35_37595, partial [Kaistia sp. SCN 65-12]